MDVQAGGTSYRVDLRRDGDDWVVSLDGRICRVDARRVAGGWSLLIGAGDDTSPRARRSYEVAFDVAAAASAGGGAGDTGAGMDAVRVHVDGIAVPVSLPSARRRHARRGSGAAAGSGTQTVVAPMPGRVARVLVAPGDTVLDRQPVAVLEAMKMQNDVRAPRAGRVLEVRAVEGALVEAGTVLAVIDAETPGGQAEREEAGQ